MTSNDLTLLESERKPQADIAVIDEPGLYDIPVDAYHRDPCRTPSLSSSIAKILIDGTPRHAWWQSPRLNPAATVNLDVARKTTFGSAAHEIFLGKGGGVHIIKATKQKAVPVDGRKTPKMVDTDEMVDNYKSKAAQDERDAAILSGKVPVLAREYARVLEVVEEVRHQLRWMGDLSGHSEITGIAEFDGVWTRFLMDRLLDDHRTIFDLKFTDGTASPAEWPRQAVRMGYEVSQGHYRAGLASVEGCGIERTDFLFGVVELGPPVMVCVHRMPIELAESGIEKAEYARRVWGECLKSNQWPGYGDKVHTGDPPMYAIAQWESTKLVNQLDWSDDGGAQDIRTVFLG